MTKNKEELVSISMKIIMHAGDARIHIQKAILASKETNYQTADELMKKAENDLKLAHGYQTDVIQENILYEEEPSCLLFAHAQDTFMCVNSEYNLSMHIINLYKQLNEVRK